MAEPIQIQGLRQFQRALKEMDAGLPKQIRLVFNGAMKVVTDDATSRMPRKSGRAVASVKARSSQREARIAIGGNRAPYVPWLDFGGKTGPQGSVVRPFIREGRYLWPALTRKRDEIEKIMTEGLVGLAGDAGLEVDSV